MILFLKVKPNQRFNKIERMENNWQVRINAQATDGRANDELVNFLSEVLMLSKSKIRLKKGHTSQMKYIEIDADTEFVNLKLEESSRRGT
jgi:uncharacterized protein (TIGR00251 family)